MEKSAEVPPPYTETTGQPGQFQQYPMYGQQYGQQYGPQQGNPPPQGQYPPPAGAPPYPAGGQQPYGYPQYPYQYNTNVVVSQPGYAVTSGPPPQDHMVSAIFVTLCCFWPTGILAILKASESRSALARGDLVAANQYAESARRMVKMSVIIGIIVCVAVTVLIGVYFGVVLRSIHDDDDDDMWGN